MNQILYTGGKNNGAMEIKKVIRIFVIGIIIYGLICVLEGSVGIIKAITNDENKNVDPYVTIEQLEEYLQIKIKHKKIIDKIIYRWNEEEEVIIKGKGQKEITENISMPEGTNKFYIKIIDNKGHEIENTSTYYLKHIDKIEPEIELLVEDSKIKIVAKDETQIKYMSYYWNEEDATKIDVREDSPKRIEEKISILKGKNTLTVVAVDEAGNETKKEQIYVGAKKPTISYYRENNILKIKVTDEDNIQKIEYTYNGKEFSSDKDNTGNPLNKKEVVCVQEMVQGVNKFNIRAYNVSGLMTEQEVEITL